MDAQPLFMHKLAIGCCLPYLVSHKAGSQWHDKVFNAHSQQSQQLPLREIMNLKKSNTLLNSLLFVSVI